METLPDAVLSDIAGRLDYRTDGLAFRRVSRRMLAAARGAAWHPDPLRPLVVPTSGGGHLGIAKAILAGRIRSIGAVAIDARASPPTAGIVVRAMGRAGLRPASLRVIARNIDEAARLLTADAGASSRATHLAIELPEPAEPPEVEGYARILRGMPLLADFELLVRGELADLADFADVAEAAGTARVRVAAIRAGDEPGASFFSLASRAEGSPDVAAMEIEASSASFASGAEALSAGTAAFRARRHPGEPPLRWLVVVGRGPPAEDRDGAVERWVRDRAAAFAPRLRVRNVGPAAAARLVAAARQTLVEYRRGDADVELRDPRARLEVEALAECSRLGNLGYAVLSYRAAARDVLGSLWGIREVIRVARYPGADVELELAVEGADGAEKEALAAEVSEFFEFRTNIWVRVV